MSGDKLYASFASVCLVMCDDVAVVSLETLDDCCRFLWSAPGVGQIYLECQHFKLFCSMQLSIVQRLGLVSYINVAML